LLLADILFFNERLEGVLVDEAFEERQQDDFHVQPD
jgi:hypothetical protein